MPARTAALAVAAVITTGALASAATAAGGPPPPTATNGHPVSLVATGLTTPTSFAFAPGAVFEGDGGNLPKKPGGVYLLKGGTATKLAGSPAFVAGLAWHNKTLYVSGGTPTGPKTANWQLLAWSGWNGTKFTKRKAIYTAPKGFQGFNGIAFGPDGRLYVGVDVGLLNNNDHGPAKTPYVYDILSIQPNGHGLKVFATGIRQPWQMAFLGRSPNPYVSDLGQDKGAKNPPDFVLRVHQGDNYGFPTCNWTPKSNCRGFTKPFKMFRPHSDIMGLAIIGKRLYMSSFLGTTGKAGEIFSMTLSGKDVKPVVTGFVAPVVGLGANHGRLYIGELTGEVFSVAP